MVRYCYVCNKKQTRNGNICLHKFPENPVICSQWKQFCRLREADDVKALYICSSHFCTEDFKWNTLTSISGKKKLLNSEAIPSIRSRKRQMVIRKKTELVTAMELVLAEKVKVKEKLCMSVTNRNKELEIINDENVEPQVNGQSTSPNIEIKAEEDVTTQTEIVKLQEMQSSSKNILAEKLVLAEKVKVKERLCMSATNRNKELEMINDENVEPQVNGQSTSPNIEIKAEEDVATQTEIVELQDVTTQTEIVELQKMQSSSKNILINTCTRSSSVTELCSTPKKRKCMEPRYIYELMTPDVKTPRRASRMSKQKFVKCNDLKRQKIIENLRRINRCLRKRINSLESLVVHLKEKLLISEDAADSFLNMMPDNLKELITRKVKCKGRYSSNLRKFALTLHFYSPKAYNYVRKTWSFLLPHPSTIKQWYRVVNGSPGFTKEALDAIELRTKGSKPVIVNLVLDEMSIREQIIYNHGKFQGGVDFGILGGEDDDNESVPAAKNALVFMAVSMNESWKIPIGYFLIRSLNGSERANLLSRALEILHDSNVHVYSVTFDGAICNQSMCNKLGANFQYGPNFKPYFTNPATKKKCFVFFDPCHMIKLIRNTLGDKKVLKTTDNLIIMWEFIVKLHKLQQEAGIKAANKLTKKHIEFSNNRMNVKLAIQTLSRSVSKSLEFLITLDDNINKKEFNGCLSTAHFCLQFNNIIDMLNCKNQFSKDEFNTALTESNYSQLKAQSMPSNSKITSLHCAMKQEYLF